MPTGLPRLDKREGFEVESGIAKVGSRPIPRKIGLLASSRKGGDGIGLGCVDGDDPAESKDFGTEENSGEKARDSELKSGFGGASSEAEEYRESRAGEIPHSRKIQEQAVGGLGLEDRFQLGAEFTGGRVRVDFDGNHFDHDDSVDYFERQSFNYDGVQESSPSR